MYRLASHVADLAAHDPKLLFPSCAAGRGALSPAGPATGRCGYLEDPPAGEPYDPSAKTLSDERYAIYGVDRLRTMYLESQQPQIHRLVNTMVRQFEAVRAQVGVGRVFPVLIPDQFQVSPAEVERVLRAAPSLRHERFDFAYTAKAVADGLTGLGFDVVDLSDAFRESLRASAEPYQPNDGHLSVVGNRLVSERVTVALRRKGVFSRRSSTASE